MCVNIALLGFSCISDDHALLCLPCDVTFAAKSAGGQLAKEWDAIVFFFLSTTHGFITI